MKRYVLWTERRRLAQRIRRLADTLEKIAEDCEREVTGPPTEQDEAVWNQRVAAFCRAAEPMVTHEVRREQAKRTESIDLLDITEWGVEDGRVGTTRFMRTCQECRNRQPDIEPQGDPSAAFLNRKCKKCKSAGLDFGAVVMQTDEKPGVERPPPNREPLSPPSLLHPGLFRREK